MSNDKSYCIKWSAKDKKYIATCAEFPSISALSIDSKRAMQDLEVMISYIEKETYPHYSELSNHLESDISFECCSCVHRYMINKCKAQVYEEVLEAWNAPINKMKKFEYKRFIDWLENKVKESKYVQ